MWHFERLKWVPCIFLMCTEKHFDPPGQEGVNYLWERTTACPGSFLLKVTSINFSTTQVNWLYFLSACHVSQDWSRTSDIWCRFDFWILYFSLLSTVKPCNVFLLPQQMLWFHNTPRWQQVSDHLSDKSESNKNTPGLVKDQSQPDRIKWAGPAH